MGTLTSLLPRVLPAQHTDSALLLEFQILPVFDRFMLTCRGGDGKCSIPKWEECCSGIIWRFLRDIVI